MMYEKPTPNQRVFTSFFCRCGRSQNCVWPELFYEVMGRAFPLIFGFFIVAVAAVAATTTPVSGEFSEECMEYGLNCPGCKLYLAPSRALGFGRGVIAGKEYVHGESIDNAPSITVPNEVAEEMILHNYIYSSEDEQFGMITFGPSMIFNHQRMDKKDVDHTWADVDVPTIDQQLIAAHSTYTNVINAAIRYDG